MEEPKPESGPQPPDLGIRVRWMIDWYCSKMDIELPCLAADLDKTEEVAIEIVLGECYRDWTFGRPSDEMRQLSEAHSIAFYESFVAAGGKEWVDARGLSPEQRKAARQEAKTTRSHVQELLEWAKSASREEILERLGTCRPVLDQEHQDLLDHALPEQREHIETILATGDESHNTSESILERRLSGEITKEEALEQMSANVRQMMGRMKDALGKMQSNLDDRMAVLKAQVTSPEGKEFLVRIEAKHDELKRIGLEESERRMRLWNITSTEDNP
jgi:hypothetical protein